MAIETRKVPAEIVIRFSPHPSRGKVGTPLTWMFREALETTEDGKQIGYKELDPVDLTQEQAEAYFGKQMADFLGGTTEERTKAAADLQAERDKAAEALAATKASYEATLKSAADFAEDTLKSVQKEAAAALQAERDKHAEELAAKEAAHLGVAKEEIMKLLTEKDQQLASERGVYEAALKSATDSAAEKDQQIAKQTTYIEAVAGMPEAQRLAKEKRLAEITAEKQAAADKQAALEAEEVKLIEAPKPEGGGK